MPFASKEREKEYNRERYLRDRIERIERQKILDKRKRAFRYSLLNDFTCFCCDELDTDLIQWHHVEPENKLFHISQMNNTDDAWWNEVLKCIPVCANCHLKIHKGKLCLIPQTSPTV